MSRRPAPPRDPDAPRRVAAPCTLCRRPTYARSGVCDRHPRRGRVLSATEADQAVQLVRQLADVLGCAGEPACPGYEHTLEQLALGGRGTVVQVCSSCGARLFLRQIGRDAV